MDDILYNAALTFKSLNEYDYKFILGRSSRTIEIVATTDKGEFTHIIGLDHLKDIPIVTAQNLQQKKKVFKKILNKEIDFNCIKDSQFLYKNSKNTFDIRKRIEAFQYAKTILEKAHTGEIFKWDNNKSNIVLSDGKTIRSTIKADYMFKIPAPEIENAYLYYFLYKISHDLKNDIIKLGIHSVFPDDIDYSMGLERPFKVLKTSRYHIKSKTEETLFQHRYYNG